jgi:hypothetical protein
VFNPLEDIVTADLALVMDKYTAADVLREVSGAVVAVCLSARIIGTLLGGAWRYV